MAINEIEVNTSTLSKDIEVLKSTLKQLDSQMKNAFRSVEELDRMWDGAANETFNQQFGRDYQSCQEMHKTLLELTQSMEHARQEYDKCEQNVDMTIRAINI